MLVINTGAAANYNYYDNNGNIRVIRAHLESKRKIKKVKSYNPETGDEEFDFYPENYIINKDLGQEEQIFWINEVEKAPRLVEISMLICAQE